MRDGVLPAPDSMGRSLSHGAERMAEDTAIERFGGSAPNKFEASAVGKGSEHASDPCRTHGQELVPQ